MSKANLEVVQATAQPKGGKIGFNDQHALDKSRTAEIVIVLCGPMGTPLHDVAKTFKQLLEGTDYQYQHVSIIRLSDEIRSIANLKKINCSTKELIEAGNDLRQKHGNAFRILPFDGVAPSRFLKFFSAHDGGRKDARTGKMRRDPLILWPR
ncbi:hypothetical protein [Trinickia dinghuensis]|nr:hypothetical protein [Trinickia dinghuensis]